MWKISTPIKIIPTSTANEQNLNTNQNLWLTYLNVVQRRRAQSEKEKSGRKWSFWGEWCSTSVPSLWWVFHNCAILVVNVPQFHNESSTIWFDPCWTKNLVPVLRGHLRLYREAEERLDRTEKTPCVSTQWEGEKKTVFEYFFCSGKQLRASWRQRTSSKH